MPQKTGSSGSVILIEHLRVEARPMVVTEVDDGELDQLVAERGLRGREGTQEFSSVRAGTPGHTELARQGTQ
eukprot:2091197-Prymnesium_polylepis.1